MSLDRLDELECKQRPMWEEPDCRKSFGEKSKDQKITISMSDLNQAIFKRKNYQYAINQGGGHHYDGNGFGHSINISTQQNGQKRTINATLNNAQGAQEINLSFQNINGHCTLTEGEITKNGVKENIQTPKRLSEVLSCMYKHVRMTADPVWATRHLMELEAREVAAQRLDFDTLPKIFADNGHLKFQKPNAEGKCGNLCGMGVCPAKVMFAQTIK